MMTIKIAMIEDDAELLASMTEYFGNTGEFDIVQRALSVEEFLQQQQRSGKVPDVILLDLMLPKMSGIDGIPFIRELYPDVHILVHSVLDDSNSIFAALKRGASGYIAKGTSLENISSALRNAYHGMSIMSQEIAGKVLDYFRGGEDISEKLSKKELEVAEALKSGLSYKMIAFDSGVTIDAIRFHVRNIYRKLAINSKGELINLMMRSTNKRS